MNKRRIPRYRLQTGFSMPVLGLGTWQLTGRQCEKAVKWALEMGYTHIDTSDDYMNEEEIGKAIRGFDRSEIFITSKVDDSMMSKGDVLKACQGTLQRLATDYVDLYLIHRPNPAVSLAETMSGLEACVKQGMVRSVGMSNFSSKGIQAAADVANIPVCVSQIKVHPYHFPTDAIQFCKENEIVITAYSPLDTGGIVDDDMLSRIGRSYGKSAAQVSLRWLLENELIIIPKSSSKEHLKENMNIFDWKLSEEDAAEISESSSQALRV